MDSNTVLGKSVSYGDSYNPETLVAIPRLAGRNKVGIGAKLPFVGSDLWNCYELTWLNSRGKPVVAMAQIICPAQSINLIESKSLKLYLMGFAGERLESIDALVKIIVRDLSAKTGCQIGCSILLDSDWNRLRTNGDQSICIDHIDVQCESFERDPTLLRLGAQPTSERLVSHLIRSLCPVTGQPDYASLTIHYQGQQIDHGSLLQYICSLRNHRGFHEECCEMIFQDVKTSCQPEHLLVACNFTRRGGIDINPVRTSLNCPFEYSFARHLRQ